MAHGPLASGKHSYVRLDLVGSCQKPHPAATHCADVRSLPSTKVEGANRRTPEGRSAWTQQRTRSTPAVASSPTPLADPERFHFETAFGFEQVVAGDDRAVDLLDPEDGVSGREHARGRAGVPRPPAPAAVPPAVVDVGGLLDRNQAVDGDSFRVGLSERRNLFEDLDRAREEPRGLLRFAAGARVRREPDETIDDPRGAVAVLAAVLAHAGRIVRDSARIGPRMLVERRLEQQHPLRPFDALEAAFERGERARVVAGAGKSGPAGRHGVRLVQNLTVVGEVEHVMVAPPAGVERDALRRQSLA